MNDSINDLNQIIGSSEITDTNKGTLYLKTSINIRNIEAVLLVSILYPYLRGPLNLTFTSKTSLITHIKDIIHKNL